MEEDLKILKVEYISNHWTYLHKMFNLSLGDQTEMVEMKTTSNRRRHRNIKNRISQQLNRSSSNFQLKLKGPNWNKKNGWNEDDLQLKKTSKY